MQNTDDKHTLIYINNESTLNLASLLVISMLTMIVNLHAFQEQQH